MESRNQAYNAVMRTVCSYKEGGVSKPLMKAFDFTEQEFENYYRLWVRKNKSNIYDSYLCHFVIQYSHFGGS